MNTGIDFTRSILSTDCGPLGGFRDRIVAPQCLGLSAELTLYGDTSDTLTFRMFHEPEFNLVERIDMKIDGGGKYIFSLDKLPGGKNILSFQTEGTIQVYRFDYVPLATPEPSTLLLLGSILAAVGFRIRKYL